MQSNAYYFTLGFGRYAAPYTALYDPLSRKLRILLTTLRDEYADPPDCQDATTSLLDEIATGLNAIYERDLEDVLDDQDHFLKTQSPLGERPSTSGDILQPANDTRRVFRETLLGSFKTFARCRREMYIAGDPHSTNGMISYWDKIYKQLHCSLQPGRFRKNPFFAWETRSVNVLLY